ncbi:hypothetical protein G3I77_01920 [Streptomyces sp. D2-8]|uniref:hypothetical protein n=1 Tax=Streptomyces sp. D2-8 TaxID=2707767 RepID=UPI0020BE4C87|nr:hypothetical protein [Streptomyces sp. D2-8]MCK8431819.1 hypothetical protein [Streptomyces sp. D2-8]
MELVRRLPTVHPSLNVVDGGGHQPAAGEGQEAGEKDPSTAELHNDPVDDSDGRHEQDGHRVCGEAKKRSHHRLLQRQMPDGRHQESQDRHHTAPGTGGVRRSGSAGGVCSAVMLCVAFVVGGLRPLRVP